MQSLFDRFTLLQSIPLLVFDFACPPSVTPKNLYIGSLKTDEEEYAAALTYL